MLKAVFQVTSSGGGWNGQLVYEAITATYNATGAEQVIEATSGTGTVNLAAPAQAAWMLFVKNSGSGTITISGTIDGGASFVLAAKQGVILVWNGTGWLAF